MRPGAHWLNPDTCVTLPVAFRFIAPDSELARRTLDSVEPLWNQEWQTGGYGRYHVSSEPDSPGGWPFASIFVARAAVEAGMPERAWRVLRWLDTAHGRRGGFVVRVLRHRDRRRPVRRWGSSRGPGRRCSRSWSSTCSACDRGRTACTSLPGCCRGSSTHPPACGWAAAMLTLHVRREAAGAPSARASVGGKLVAERADGEIDLDRHRAPRRRRRHRHRPSARMTLHG